MREREHSIFSVASRIVYVLVFMLQTIVYHVLFGFSIKGKRHLRGLTGKAILISNHSHYLDPGFVAQAIWPRRTLFTGLEKTFKMNRLFCWFITSLGGIPISDSNPGTILQTAHDMISNTPYFIHLFPEGEMTQRNRTLKPFKPGAFSIAVQNDLPVIPIIICSRRRKVLPFDKITCYIEPPIYPPHADSDTRDSKKQAVALFATSTRDLMQEKLNLYFP